MARVTEEVKRRPLLSEEPMTAVELLCQALATLYEAGIIDRVEARRMLAEYGMEPRDDDQS